MTLAAISSAAQDDITVVTFSGKLDDSNIEQHAAEVEAAMTAAPAQRFVFDFTKLEYLNSQAIGNLNTWYVRASEAGGEIKLAGAAGTVLDVLEMMALDQYFEMHPTVDAARSAFEVA